MARTDELVADYRKIRIEYAYDADIMNEEDERVREIKRIVNTKLSVVDKTLIILYADCGSFRKLGERLGVSHMTIRKEILRIRKIILKEYEENKNTA